MRIVSRVIATVALCPLVMLACGGDSTTKILVIGGPDDAAATPDATSTTDAGTDAGRLACSTQALETQSVDLVGGGDERLRRGGIVPDGTYQLIRAVRYGVDEDMPLGETYELTLVVKGKKYEIVSSGNIPADGHQLLTAESGTISDNTQGSFILAQSCPGTTEYNFGTSQYSNGISLYTSGKTDEERVEYFFRSDADLACPGTVSFTTSPVMVEAGSSTSVTVHVTRSAEAKGRDIEIRAGKSDLDVGIDELGKVLVSSDSELAFDVYASAFDTLGAHTVEVTADISSDGCVVKGSVPVTVTASTVLDGTFGKGGTLTLPPATVGNAEDFVDLSAFADGSLAVLTTPSGPLTYRLHRLTAAGALDPSFASTGTVVLPSKRIYVAHGVTALPDGKVLVSGRNVSDQGVVLRYLTDGTLDPTWGTNGVAIVSTGHDTDLSLAVLAPDGSVIAVGYGDNGLVAKLTTAGVPDLAFGTDGYVRDEVNHFDHILVRADDSILVAGHDYTPTSVNPSTTVRAFDSKGAILTTFATSGVATFGRPDDFKPPALLPTPDGKVLVFVPADDGGDADIQVTRLTALGAVDTTYGVSGVADTHTEPGSSYTHLGVAADSTGRVYMPFTIKNATVDVGRLNADGSPDTTYGPKGLRSLHVGNVRVNTYSVAMLTGSNHVVAATRDSDVILLKFAK